MIVNLRKIKKKINTEKRAEVKMQWNNLLHIKGFIFSVFEGFLNRNT